VTVETFAQDLWEALRQELREQIGGVIRPEEFDSQVPSWDLLSPQARQQKVQAVRMELLRPILRAGYEIRRRV